MFAVLEQHRLHLGRVLPMILFGLLHGLPVPRAAALSPQVAGILPVIVDAGDGVRFFNGCWVPHSKMAQFCSSLGVLVFERATC